MTLEQVAAGILAQSQGMISSQATALNLTPLVWMGAIESRVDPNFDPSIYFTINPNIDPNDYRGSGR